MKDVQKKEVFYGKLVISLMLCLGGGWLSGLVTKNGLEGWYQGLLKPEGTPPKIVFPIVWTALYILMAISLTYFWTSPTKNKSKGTFFFLTQLVLNFLWSYLFFYLKNPLLGLIDIGVLILFVILTINSFWKHSKWASVLLIPYLIWISYAFYLNLFIWISN
jgi:benzodiazapine receptor